ncbi:MAG: hypothetical protein JST30_06120 [Armatimonadetes bacterium]|nr:hypothetical protein [Armatimonadota bacterium]
MSRLLHLRAWLGIAVAAAAGTSVAQDDDRSRGTFDWKRFSEQQAALAPPPSPEAYLSAFVKAERFPLYRDRQGAIGRWEEIGPSVLIGGWGGMENCGRTTALVVDHTDSQTLYAGAASGGLWKSVDGGGDWKPLADRQASLAFGALAIDPMDRNVVYAGTGEPHYAFDSFAGVGMLKSRDGGAHWELLGPDVFAGHSFTRIVLNPERSGFLYASTTGGVYRSTDGGSSWVRLLGGPASDLMIDPRDPDTLIAAVGAPWGNPFNGLYRTRDAGQHWERLVQDLPFNGWAIGRIQMGRCDAFPNVVYASFYGSNNALYGVYKSTDSGDRWLRLPNVPDYGGGQGWYDNYLTVSPANPNVVFVGGTSTYRTVDGGQNWSDNTRSYAGGPVHPDHHFFTFDPNRPDTVYLCGDGGVFRSDDLGGTWRSACNGMGTVQFQSVDVHPTDPGIAYGGTQDNGTNKRAGSQAWRHVFSGDGGVTRVDWRNPDTVYTEYVNLIMYKSTDAGNSWTEAFHGIDLGEGALFYAPFNLDPSNPEILVAGTQSVWRSTDGAVSWRRISPPLGWLLSAVSIAPNNGSVIYAGSSGGGIWVTADTGKSWFDVTKGPPRAYVSDLCIDPANARHVYLAQAAWGGNRVWESTDAGASWTAIGDGLPQVPARCLTLDPHDRSTLYLGTEVGVFVLKPGGRWERLGQGLPNSPVMSIVANPRTGFLTVGTHGRGAWRIALP